MELSEIQSKIYEIRGYKVMLDFDLAESYGIETRVLKQAVRRNLKRFARDDFMFEVTKEELSRSQIVTLNKGRGSNIKYLPFAFTELGVAMLSSVLNSNAAIEINRGIMRAFVAIRTYLDEYSSTSKEITRIWERVKALEKTSEENLKAINDLSEDTGRNFDDIYIALSELARKQKDISEVSGSPRRPIGYIRPKEEE
ncbi:MAG: ORF6N domain-containing protein [Tannerella sp.]|jgi:hypothetical protein|nr:ORF6N domain-containing protein [Tannerella sp.]